MTQPDEKTNKQPHFLFKASANRLPLLSAIFGIGFLGLTVFLIWYYLSPYNTEVGYSPKQPIAYSHKLHAGDLGLDCRYCHTQVESTAVAMIPPTQTCMNCHKQVKKDSALLTLLRESYASQKPVPWIRVHRSPDYVYFNHGSHVSRGVGCEECHGRIDQMVQVKQVAPMSMGWCLDCHRNPGPHLRPVSDVTKMGWQPPLGETKETFGAKLLQQGFQPVQNGQDKKIFHKIQPPSDCSRCHR